MKSEIARGLRWGLAVITFLGASTVGALPPKEPVTDNQSASALSPEQLTEQIRQLQATLADVLSEMKRTRAESAELRKELKATQKELALVSSRQANSRSVSGTVASDAQGGAPAPSPEQPRAQDTQELARLQEDVQLLTDKVNDQYQTKVESASKYRVRLSGIMLLNVFGNRGTVDNQDVPSLARPKTALGSAGDFGATVRQSQLGLEVFGPTIAGARSSANVAFDFFGGFPATIDGVTAGLVRMRTARVRLDWNSTSVVAGQDEPFFSPLSPTSLASLALPAFSYSGNLWVWTPQVRVEQRIASSEASILTLQAGILDPLTGETPYSQFYRRPEAGERSRQPAYASRVAWSRKVWGQPISFGVGGYYARQNWGFDRTVDAWAGTADWTVPLGPRLSLTGEFYRGRGLGGLGGGTGRSVLFSGDPTNPQTLVLGLNTVGGWSQLKFMATPKLEFNTAFGEDLPFSRDLERFAEGTSYVYSTIGENQSGFFNMIYRARSNLLFGAEYRRLWTAQAYIPKLTADQVNLSVGVLF